MPYSIVKSSQGYCVVNSATNEEMGCKDSRADAVKHMAALYAAEGNSSKEIDGLVAIAIADFTKETGEVFLPEEIDQKSWGEEVGYFHPWGAKTYAEVEAQREAMKKARAVSELLDMFPSLARNTMDSPEVSDKGAAIEALASELAGKIAELTASPTASPEDGEMKDAPASEPPAETPIEDEIKHSKESRSLLSSIGEMAEKILSYVKSVTGNGDDQDSDLMIWKDKDGQYRWLARYSNNFIDDDNPPDIISAKSHRRFAEMVDKGDYPYPVIELWHESKWEFGRADWVAYDDSGFALASGYVYPGCEGIAKSLSKLKSIGVSHGMPVTSIVRDSGDPRVIVEHQTVEISPLPLWAAANKLTSFQIVKDAGNIEEDDMGLPKDKKEAALKNWGVSPELLSTLESLNQKDAAAATEAGIESKEANPVPEDETPDAPVAEAVAEASEAEGAEEDKSEAKEADTLPGIKEVSEAFAEVVAPMVATIKSLQEQVESLTKELTEVKAIKTEAERVREDAMRKEQAVAALSPVAALMGTFASARAVGDSATEVKEGDPLNNQKPKEFNPSGPITGIQFLDNMLAPRQ